MAATEHISGSDSRMAIAQASTSYAPGSIGSAADKSGAGPKPQPPAFTSPSEKRPWREPLESRR
jgi:hypothetical protein